MEIFLKQIEKLLNSSDNKDGDNYQAIAAAQMYKMMLRCIVKYIEQQVKITPEFEKLLTLEWKSAERMLNYVIGKAKSLAINIPGANGTACCIPDEMVYDWVYEYYQLDDKAKVEEERRKAAEAKAKKEAEDKKRAENKIKAREKAIEKLSVTEGWAEKSEEDKEKEIAKEASSIEYKLNREIGKEKKPITKKSTVSKKSKKTGSEEAEKTSAPADLVKGPELTEKKVETPAPAGTVETPVLSTEEDGQFSLDLAG